MKKINRIATITLSSLFCVSAASCGGEVIKGINKNRTQIYIQIFDGGTGAVWLDTLAKEWNMANETYEVIIDPQMIAVDDVMTDVGTGSHRTDCYYVTEVGFKQGIEKGDFEDLSDILDMKAEGETRTIGDKLLNKEKWLSLASDKNGDGCYLLPYADSMLGFVFNYDTFEKRGWLIAADASSQQVKDDLTAEGIVYSLGTYLNTDALIFESSSSACNYEKGDVIMRAGRDGKYGTYDDGQPISFQEWSDMLGYIRGDGVDPFLITGKYLTYINPVMYALIAQLGGIDDFNTYFSFNSEGKAMKMHDGTTKVITIDNGYDVYGLQSLYGALDFVNDYFADPDYASSYSYDGTLSHIDAQDKYILGEANTKNVSEAAMLVEGIWWENEARSRFKTMAEKEHKPEFTYGTRDYRYMLYPDIEGQAETEKSVMSTYDSGSFVVAKMKDEAKLAALKEFIVYTLSDKALRYFTVETGCVRPFDYELTSSDREQMTSFAKNCYDIYKDTENVRVVRPFINKYSEPLTFASTFPSLSSQEFTATVGGVAFANVIKCLRDNKNVDTVFAGLKASYPETTWASYVSKARESGFYK